MAATFKQLTDFFIAIGADQIEHTESVYLAHAIGVYNDLRSWGSDEEVCRAGLFHSIYGTEGFQRFTLPLERRDEVRALTSERAERLAYLNCAMDRASFDAAVERAAPPYRFRDRLADQGVELSEADFDDLCTIHLCDWCEQVPRSKRYSYRTDAYGRLAQRLGGVALASYRRVLTGSGVADCQA
jgi:Domain of unknown function (DUF6817)